MEVGCIHRVSKVIILLYYIVRLLYGIRCSIVSYGIGREGGEGRRRSPY